MRSQAQIDASRANSRKSTGPKTARGKRIASLNALKHGGRSRKQELLRDDSLRWEERKLKWLEGAEVGGDMAEFLSFQNLMLAGQLETAQRACLQGRRDAIENADDNEIKEVERIGKRLFDFPAGHRALYGIRPASTKELKKTSATKEDDDPAELVKKLESCDVGCAWLTSHWTALRANLEPGRFWDSCDRLKAIRLLGAQAIECIEDETIAEIFVASHTLNRLGESAFEDLRSD